MNRLFLIANIQKQIFSINPDHIETVGFPSEHEGVVCNTLMMASGEEHVVPVQMIISMLNTCDYTVYDLITPKESADLADDNLDVNDTEYKDETPLEEPNDKIEVINYGDEFDDGHPELGEYITAVDDLPDTNVSVEDIIEAEDLRPPMDGSVASG